MVPMCNTYIKKISKLILYERIYEFHMILTIRSGHLLKQNVGLI
jgi:hypothetical protein